MHKITQNCNKSECELKNVDVCHFLVELNKSLKHLLNCTQEFCCKFYFDTNTLFEPLDLTLYI